MQRKSLTYSLLFHLILGFVLYCSLSSLEYGGQFEFALDTKEIQIEFQKASDIKPLPVKVPEKAVEEKKPEKPKEEKVKEEVKKEEVKKEEPVKKVEETKVVEEKPAEVKKVEEKKPEEKKPEVKPTAVAPATEKKIVNKEVEKEIEKEIEEKNTEEDITKKELENFKNDFGDESLSFSGFYGDKNAAFNLVDLSSRQKQIFLNQIKVCKARAEEVTKYGGDKSVEIIVSVNENGFFDIDNMVIVNKKKFKNANEEAEFNKAVATAKQTLVECNPLRNMPDDKYFIWKRMKLNFRSTGGKNE